MMVTSSSNWRLMNFSVFRLDLSRLSLVYSMYSSLRISKNFLARPERVLLE